MLLADAPARPAPSPDLVFRALGDPTRRALLERLGAGARPAKDLQGLLGISLTAVIQHLGVLEQSGLVHTEKTGRTRTCRLAPEGLAVAANWIQARQAFWASRLDRLGDLLDEEEG